MKGLTNRQTEVLSFIKHFITVHKFPPTVREISDNFSISVRGAYDHIKVLEKKGAICCDTMRSRAIVVLDSGFIDSAPAPAPVSRRIPVLGTVAAGAPVLSVENREGEIPLPCEMLGQGNYFALHIRGDSMVDVGIMDGDLAIVKEQNTAENGEIIVAMIDEAFTLKRFYRESNRVRLQAENKEYPPIYTRDIRILGKLEHIIRSY